MKVLHILAKSNTDIKLTKTALKKLANKKLGIVTTIQHLHKLANIQKQLKDSTLIGQILGCSVLKTENKKINSLLYIGTGEFHPLNLARHTNLPVWTWNPETKTLKQLPQTEKENYQKKQQGLLNKYLHAKTIGIIVSLKPGQMNTELARELAKNTKKENYIFLCNNVIPAEFENFNFIDFWVNTACPRIIEDSNKMINIDDLIANKIFKPTKEKK